MDIGAHLRSARERRGLTLEQVANSTKVSPAVLRFIERNEWERLPGGLLTRGHLRAYAGEVGVDAEQVIHEYLSQMAPASVAAPRPAVAPAADTTPTIRPILVAIVGFAVTFGIYDWLNDRSEAPIAPSTDAVQLPATSEPGSVEREELDPVVEMKRHESPLSLDIAVTGPCWVSARADGRLVVYRLLEAGEAVTVAANQELVLRVGDPARFRYTLNGVSGRALGDSGRPVTVTITEGNVQSFFADAVPDAITRS